MTLTHTCPFPDKFHPLSPILPPPFFFSRPSATSTFCRPGPDPSGLAGLASPTVPPGGGWVKKGTFPAGRSWLAAAPTPRGWGGKGLKQQPGPHAPPKDGLMGNPKSWRPRCCLVDLKPQPQPRHPDPNEGGGEHRRSNGTCTMTPSKGTTTVPTPAVASKQIAAEAAGSPGGLGREIWPNSRDPGGPGSRS